MHKLLCTLGIACGLFILASYSINFAARSQITTTPAIVALACAYNSVYPTSIAGQYNLVQCTANGNLAGDGTGVTLTSGAVVPASASNPLTVSTGPQFNWPTVPTLSRWRASCNCFTNSP